MKLVIMRHAEAVDVPENGERPLTPKGHRDAEKMGRLLQRCGWDWSGVRCSPVLRARQTAEHVAPLLVGEPTIDPLLQPGLTPERFLSSFDDFNESSALLCIFHMPDIALVAAAVLGIDTSHLYFSPGCVMAINLSGQGDNGMQIFQYQPDFIN